MTLLAAALALITGAACGAVRIAPHYRGEIVAGAALATLTLATYALGVLALTLTT